MEIEGTTFGTITIRNWSFGSGGNGLGLFQVIAASGALQKIWEERSRGDHGEPEVP